MGNPKGTRSHLPQLSIRACIVLIGVGLGFELLVILLHMLIESIREQDIRILGFKYTDLFLGNAVVGLIGTVIVSVGIVFLISSLHVSRRAAIFGYTGVLSIILYKLMDVNDTRHRLYFRDLFDLNYDIDTLVMDSLLVSCAMSLLVAMIYALFDLIKTEKVLEEQNRALDREIQERRLFTTAIQNAAESIMITDASGAILYINPAFESLTQFNLKEVKGRNPSILKSGTHDKTFYKELWDTISAGKVWRGRLMNKRKDGELFTEDATISAIQDEQGHITHYVAVKHDITREKLLEQQVQQSQKLEAIGTLAGGIAHDLNNVLAVIVGHSEMSLGQLEPGHPVRKSLEVIMRTAERSSQLIKRLLVFSRQGVSESSPLEPSSLVREQMKVIRSYLPSNIAISDFIDPDAGYVLGAPIEIQQIVFNLCTNANHAMQPKGGALEIGIGRVVVEQERLLTVGVLAPGDYVRLYVCDTGCGMDAAILKRIFEPFFTTKEAGMGTGLGLPMIHGSVMQSGGAIEVTSTPGKGSRFDLYWPRLACEPQQEPSVIDIPDGGGRTVLVVDDMVDFKELLEVNLTAHGFKAEGFTEVYTALDFFKGNSDTIDIALVDYMMPGMNGGELAERLHEIKPGLPVIMLSGYSSDVTEENAAMHGFEAVISKPVETAHLINTISRCLS
jgi:PAS domain S-box-containing protein